MWHTVASPTFSAPARTLQSPELWSGGQGFAIRIVLIISLTLQWSASLSRAADAIFRYWDRYITIFRICRKYLMLCKNDCRATFCMATHISQLALAEMGMNTATQSSGCVYTTAIHCLVICNYSKCLTVKFYSFILPWGLANITSIQAVIRGP